MSFLDRNSPGIASVGIYTLEQAATLVRLRLRDCLTLVAERPSGRSDPRTYPIAFPEVDLGFGEKLITFSGLMELWVAAELHRNGVPWTVIRYASFQATKVLGTDYPLTRGHFRTDGRKVFLSLTDSTGKKPRTAIDLLNRQQVFEDVIERSLSPAIVVRDATGRILKWFPLGKKFSVVLDPERRFGEPIDPDSGVPTASLAQAYHAEQDDLSKAAAWFGTSRKAIKDAVAFEQWLQKA